MSEKNKGFGVVVITHNNPNNLHKLLSSLEKLQGSQPDELLVVDDSSNPSFRKRDKKLAMKNNFHYVGKNEWRNFKSFIFELLPTKNKRKKLLENIGLGLNKWNTPNSRRVSKILSFSVLDCDRFLYLDDDMRFEPTSDIFSTSSFKGLKGIGLAGSPDLSRSEWISLFSRYALGGEVHDGFGENYTNRLIRELSMEQIKTIIDTYTHLTDDSGNGVEIEMPLRSEFHGGAYLASEESTLKGFHPPWYDEDWAWFSCVRESLGLEKDFSDLRIKHDSGPKKVLDKGSLLFEELGILYSKLYKLCVSKTISEETTRKVIKERSKELMDEISLTKLALNSSNHGYSKSKILKMLECLKSSYELLQGVDVESSIKKVRNFYEMNSEWEKVLRESKDAIQGGQKAKKSVSLIS